MNLYRVRVEDREVVFAAGELSAQAFKALIAMDLPNSILDTLVSYLAGQLPSDILATRVKDAEADISQLLGRAAYLRLKHGDPIEARHLLLKIKTTDADYLAQHDARLIVERSDTRLLVEDQNVCFENQTPDTLRKVVNNSVGFAFVFFTHNVQFSRIEIQITEHQIEHVSINVALNFLYMYNGWKNTSPDKYRDLDLALTHDDLLHPYTRDETLFYCEKQFPKNYQVVAACLLGITLDEFVEWETCRKDFWARR